MKNTTLGFLFDDQGEYVLLIRKNRPEFQVGKYNGIGGLCGANESAFDCMIREFEEETSLKITDWEPLHTLKFDDAYVHCFYAFSDVLYGAQSLTDEELIKFRVDRLPGNLVKNVHDLIMLAICEQRAAFYRKECAKWNKKLEQTQ